MKTKYFEEFLKDKFAKEYKAFDDDMPDAYEKWISEMPIDDVISLGEEFGQEQYEKAEQEARYDNEESEARRSL